MLKRWIIGVGVLALLAAAALVVMGLWSQPRAGVSRENFRRLHKDMTEKEVAALMGECGTPMEGMTGQKFRSWHGPDFEIVIVFDTRVDERVAAGYLTTDDGSREELRDAPVWPYSVIRRWLR